MFRLDQRAHNPDANWEDLSRAERKSARRLWTWALESSLDTAPQGRPNKIDPAMVLYCACVIAEGCGKPHLRFSRPALGGAPSGPMWRALMTALPLAHSFLNLGRRPEDMHTFGGRAEAVVDIFENCPFQRVQGLLSRLWDRTYLQRHRRASISCPSRIGARPRNSPSSAPKIASRIFHHFVPEAVVRDVAGYAAQAVTFEPEM